MLSPFVVRLGDGAERDWLKLDGSVRLRVISSLRRMETQPDMRHRLSGTLANYFSIEVASRYRVVFKVDLVRRAVLVVAIGKRENLEVYRIAAERVANEPENREAEPN